MGTADPDPPEESPEELLVRCQDRLRRRIRWMMGEQARLAADTDDFLGEMTVRIIEQMRSLSWRDEAHFLALATRVARNLIVDHVRRPRIKRFESFTAQLSAGQLPGVDDSTPSQAAARVEDVDLVLGAMERLRDDDQRVIELRHFDGLAFAEIGERMGRSEAAVQMLHARAVTRLGTLLRR